MTSPAQVNPPPMKKLLLASIANQSQTQQMLGLGRKETL